METEHKDVYRPNVGELVMKGHAEGNLASCGVVLQVFSDEAGKRFYIIQMNRPLLMARGPERITEDEFLTLGFHPATPEEWKDDYTETKKWVEEQVEKLYKAIEPYVSSAGNVEIR